MLYIHYKRFNKISKKIAMFTSSCVVKKLFLHSSHNTAATLRDNFRKIRA